MGEKKVPFSEKLEKGTLGKLVDKMVILSEPSLNPSKREGITTIDFNEFGAVVWLPSLLREGLGMGLIVVHKFYSEGNFPNSFLYIFEKYSGF